MTYYPGETNLRAADVVVLNKIDTADYENVRTVRANVEAVNPNAVVVEAASPLFVENPENIRGKRVLVVEDGPTLTHGEMAYGAGYVAAQRFGAAEIIDPRPYAVESISQTYRKYPGTGPVLPAMGYGQRADARPGDDDQQHAVRPGRRGHADRSDAAAQDRASDGARALRVAGHRQPDAGGGYPRAVSPDVRFSIDVEAIWCR